MIRLLFLVFLFSNQSLLAQEWDSLNAIGFTSYKLGEFEQAERPLKQALEVAERSFGQTSNPYIREGKIREL